MQSKSSLKDKKKLQERCAILVEVSRQLGQIYNAQESTATQKHYIETILGAALWYLPTSKELWTGKISLEALRHFHPESNVLNPRLTEDHEFPRKVSAIELMSHQWDCDDAEAIMLSLYLKKFGRFNYITPTENKILVNHQKTHVFRDPLEAYKRANVSLIEISSEELKRIKKRAITETCG